LNTVFFRITDSSDAPKVIKAIKSRIKGSLVGKVFPDAKSAELQCDYFVKLDEKASTSLAVSKLQSIDAVSDVEVPERRGLL
jgi:hypothetical protein